MRVGELLALTPADILPSKRIDINKNYAKVNGEELFLEPKTPKAKRCISIPDFLYDDIREYISKLYGIENGDRLFYFTKSALDKEIKCIAAKIGLPAIRVHDLRHPYVKHKTKSFLRNSRVFKADFCAPSHSLCTEVFHFPDNINLISGVNIHTFNQCVSHGGI